MNRILTIGYGNRSISDVIDLLRSSGASYLVDVRSIPRSRQPQFDRESLRKVLQSTGIRYVYMGDVLGGRPTSADYYVNGRVDYERLGRAGFYQAGIKRLEVAWSKSIVVSLLCSELKPEECHRSKLIGQTLAALGVPVAHIDSDGRTRTQEEIIARVHSAQLHFFGEAFTSRKTYKPRGDSQP